MTIKSGCWRALAAVVILAVAPCGMAPAFGQPQPAAAPPGVQDAARLLAQKDPAGAATILEGVTAREPKNARAWRMFGIALQQSGELDRALEAYHKAIAIQPDPVATYNIGTVYAKKKDADRAFEWLGKARATGKMDMTLIQVDADLAALSSDPRFKALLPSKADFARPFVEDTRIIREWHGEAMQDQFGWIARGIGDVDKDGVQDFVASAPFKSAGGPPMGRIYVYSTRSGRLLWQADGAAGERLGIGVEAAGDTNADGIGDVVASAPGSGKAYVYSGKDGTVLLTLAPSDPQSPLSAVAGAGDVNGDGRADIIAGAVPQQKAVGAGKAYIYSGKDGQLLGTLTGERNGDGFGSAVDGHSDGKQILLVVGAPQAGPANTGRTYVYKALSGAPSFTIDSDDTGAALGAMFVAVAGDMDGDRVADVYASDFPNRAKGPSTGRIYVHSGKSGARILTLTGETAGEGFGTSASYAGDVDGDGRADLAVGAWQYAGAAPSGGRIYLHSGKDGRLLRTFTCRIPGDTLGFDSVGIGDADGDGTIDLLLTSAYSGINGYRSGRIFVVSSASLVHR
jgi:hypothetical protein